jgi:hypothetical protein
VFDREFDGESGVLKVFSFYSSFNLLYFLRFSGESVVHNYQICPSIFSDLKLVLISGVLPVENSLIRYTN